MSPAEPQYDHRFRAMGGPCRLRLDCADEARATRAIAAAEAEARRLESKYSRYLPGSLTSAINGAAGTGQPVPIDGETAGLLGFAHTLWQQSGGLFDLTAGVLRRAWDFKSGRLPAQATIDRLLPLIGWGQVQWDEASVCLPMAGMEIDFGGCVKEYASDSIAGVLARYGIERGLVDMAGDMAVVGVGCAVDPWPVGIRHPRESGAAIAHINLASGGLASSGDYERCLQIDGRRYGHILNPATGWPVRGLVAVSIAAPQCLVAGGSATIAMLKPEAEALAWLRELGLPWLAVDSQLYCYGEFTAVSP
jgi:thiamine biosynthesis lipoprotein